MEPKRYRYVGAEEIRRSAGSPPHFYITRPADVQRWVRQTGQRLDQDCEITATFIIDEDERLWIADRHTEHVACARGRAVLAAGEITFTLEKRDVAVTAITNQSTGYCPEPTTWKIIGRALAQATLPHPEAFTTAYEFRRCDACNTISIIKDDLFECAVCESELNAEWNVC